MYGSEQDILIKKLSHSADSLISAVTSLVRENVYIRGYPNGDEYRIWFEDELYTDDNLSSLVDKIISKTVDNAAESFVKEWEN